MDISKIPLSPIVQANGFSFLSGQLGFKSPGVLVEGGIREQTRQALSNIQAILSAHGSDLSHILKTTIWLVSADDFPAFNEEYASFFGEQRFPARSTVVSSLVVPGAKVEIEVIAKCP